MATQTAAANRDDSALTFTFPIILLLCLRGIFPSLNSPSSLLVDTFLSPEHISSPSPRSRAPPRFVPRVVVPQRCLNFISQRSINSTTRENVHTRVRKVEVLTAAITGPPLWTFSFFLFHTSRGDPTPAAVANSPESHHHFSSSSAASFRQ